jgi:hypothetical protein
MPRYWIGVAASETVGTAVAEGVLHLSLGGREALQRLEPGDVVALYAPRTRFRHGDRVQSFVAIGAMEGKATWLREWADEGLVSWVRMARYEEGLEPAPIRPLLPFFSFIGNPRYWGIAFRSGLIEVSEGDIGAVRRAMSAHV